MQGTGFKRRFTTTKTETGSLDVPFAIASPDKKIGTAIHALNAGVKTYLFKTQTMQTKEIQQQTDDQFEQIAKMKQELIGQFPTRQQRRAEERKRRKAETKREISKSQKFTF